VVLSETPLSRLWFKPDTKFKTPKAFIALDFVCPESYISPETSVLTRLFAKLLVDYLNEYGKRSNLMASDERGLDRYVNGLRID
jgi:insulysin